MGWFGWVKTCLANNIRSWSRYFADRYYILLPLTYGHTSIKYPIIITTPSKDSPLIKCFYYLSIYLATWSAILQFFVESACLGHHIQGADTVEAVLHRYVINSIFWGFYLLQHLDRSALATDHHNVIEHDSKQEYIYDQAWNDDGQHWGDHILQEWRQMRTWTLILFTWS